MQCPQVNPFNDKDHLGIKCPHNGYLHKKQILNIKIDTFCAQIT